MFKPKNPASQLSWRKMESAAHVELLETRRLLATFTVAVGSDGGTSELRSAITASYSSPAPNTIVFSSALGGTTIAFSDIADEYAGPAALAVDGGQQLFINGATSNGEVTIGRASGAPNMRLFNVYGSNTDLILENLTLTGGVAAGFTSDGNGGGSAGMGGAIFNAADVVLEYSTISNCKAIGASGGSYTMSDSIPYGAGGAGGGGLGSIGTYYDGGGPNNGVSAPFGTQSNGTAGGFGGGGGGGGNYVTDFAAGAGGNGGFGAGGGGAGDSTNDEINPAPGGASGGFGGGGGATFYDSEPGPGGFGGGLSDVYLEQQNNDAYEVGGAGAGMGGAVFNLQGSFNIDQSTISNNSATGGAGDAGLGAANGGSSLGGGIFTDGGNVQVIESTIANNSTIASGLSCGGGGIYNFDGTVNSENSTFMSNAIVGSAVTENGTAVYNNGDAGTAQVTLTDTILVGSGSFNAIYSVNSSGGTSYVASTVSVTTGSNTTVTGLTTVSAASLLLAPLGNYGGSTQTIALLPGSTAIDAGLANGMAADQRGVPIPHGVAPDIGAFQSQASRSLSQTAPRKPPPATRRSHNPWQSASPPTIRD